MYITYNKVTNSWHSIVLTSAHMEVSGQCTARTSSILHVCLYNKADLIGLNVFSFMHRPICPNEMAMAIAKPTVAYVMN